MQDSIGKAHQKAGFDAVPVGNEDDEEHAQQGDGAAVGQLKYLDEAGGIGQGHGHGAVGQTAGVYPPPFSPLRQGQACQETEYQQSGAQGVAGGGEAAFRVDEQVQHKEFLLVPTMSPAVPENKNALPNGRAYGAQSCAH